MNNLQKEILEKTKEALNVLIVTSKTNNPDFNDFENDYNKLMTLLSDFIEKEVDKDLKSSYVWEYNSIEAYGKKGKGMFGVKSDYEKSIKKNASIKSKSVFETSLKNAAEHIASDFNTFFHLISTHITIDKSKI